MTCGIYCITNLINGKQYVGQSVDVEKRMDEHIHSDNNSRIHQAIVKYGVKNFRFEPLIRCSPEELDEQEVKFIRLLGTYENGYNQTRGGQHHVFNIEYNYENYAELKKKISDKNEIISSLKKDISSLKRELLESKRESNVRIGKLNQIIKNLEDNISKSDEYLMGKNKGVEITSTDILKYKREIKTLYIEKESLNEKKEQLENENAYLHKIIDSSQEGKLSDKIKTLSTKNNKLKKDIKQFKNDIRVLNETVEERDKIIMQRDRQVQILHERLGWLPKSDENTVYEENGKIIGVKSPKNIFAELLEGK